MIENSKEKLNILILTFNEEIHIRRCLESVIDLNSNIYIVDSGSNDLTLEIAREYNTKILFHEFVSQKEQIKWFLSKKIVPNKSWILRLDADEYLPEESIYKINHILKNIDHKICLIYLRLQRIFQGKHLKYGTLSGRLIPRLWKVGFAFFTEKCMDEKLVVKKGYKFLHSKIDFFDASLISPINFVIKHTNYVERQLLDFEKGVEKKSTFLKKVYYLIPFEISSFLMFIYRYFFRLGFLDGRKGLWYHFLQCLFYRNLIGIEENIRSSKNKK